MMPRISLLFVFLFVFLTACGDDTVGEEKAKVCEFGEKRNPITNTCDPVTINPNSRRNNENNVNNVNNNASTNNTNTNNASTNNANNSGSNNLSDMGADMDDADMGPDMPRFDMPPMECGPATLMGIACEPSGGLLIAVDVKLEGVDCDGNPFTLMTRTDQDGKFEFIDVPSGSHTLTIESGSFNSTRGAFLRKGQTTDLTADKVCLDANSVKIAVIGGSYDHVEGILGTLNLNYDIKGDDSATLADSVAFLKDATQMAQYDIIFINCGEHWNRMAPLFPFLPDDRPAVVANLRDFVNNGGSLYASDWSAPFVELAFPDVIDFYGDDTQVNEARKGYAPQTISASVQTADLQAVLNNSMTATIEFPHDPPNQVYNNNWSVAAGVGPDSVVQVQGDADLCAPGSLATGACPSVDGSQAAAPLLVTWKSPMGGTLIFTSFHNERQSALNQDMERILRFLIFRL